jgi:hypothetical protein
MFSGIPATLIANETLSGPRCDYVISFNARHLRAAGEFGIEVLKPVDLLKLIGEIK